MNNSEKVYRLDLFYEQGNLNRSYDFPQRLRCLYDKIQGKVFMTSLFFYEYLLLNPNCLENEEFFAIEKKSNNRYDVENIGLSGMWVVSERFKKFIQNEGIQMKFFPTKIEGERRHLMMWRDLPVITGYETDTDKAKYLSNGKSIQMYHAVFRSDLLKYLENQMFSVPSYTFMFITERLKEKLQFMKFQFTYHEYPVTHIQYDEQKIQKDLQFATKMERELWLVDNYRDRLQSVDDYLEKVLIEEGDEAVLNKFRTEMKGIWKRDFERYENGEMKPLDRIKYW